MDNLNDRILFNGFLEKLLMRASNELRQVKAEKAKGNKNFQILVRIEQLEASIKELNEIGQDDYWGLIEEIKKEYKVELKAFKKPEK